MAERGATVSADQLSRLSAASRNYFRYAACYKLQPRFYACPIMGRYHGFVMVPLDFFQRGNAAYLERLQAQFERDPQSVDPQWRAFFSGFEAGSTAQAAAASLASQDGKPADQL